MRLDLFLKASRLVLRRSSAQELCDADVVFVNGQQAKSSKEIKPGDEIRIERRHRRTVVKVTSVPKSKQVSKSAAAEHYEMIEDIPLDDMLISRGSA